MAINVSVQYNGVFLLDMILLTQCCYYHRGTRLNVMKRFFPLQPMIPPKHFDIFPSCLGMLRRFRCVQILMGLDFLNHLKCVELTNLLPVQPNPV